MSESALWRRLDRPGHDAARLDRTAKGARLEGTAVFGHESGPACIHYSVTVDRAWRTRSGTVRGFLAGRTIRHTIVRAAHEWYLDGALMAGLAHLDDLDYGFTPATNLLQLRRLQLRPGSHANLPVAWLDVDATTLTQLAQTYRCVSETTYEYSAPDLGYRAVIELASPEGFVKSYPRLWTLVQP